MSNVHFEYKIRQPLSATFKTVGDILRDIARQETAWKGFALHANLGDAGLPDVGYVAVPIALTIGESTPGINQYPIQIRADRHPESFPAFEGAIAVDMDGNSASVLTLGGRYDVPLGPFGSLVNVSLLRGLAQRSLENFITDIAEACAARIEKREADLMRYSTFHAR